MKMVKKILLGTLAVAAVLSLASCGKIEDDDKDAIKGSGTSYSIDYKNESGNKYRAYKSTSLNHAGALVKIKFDNGTDATAGTSKMGVIFNLKEVDGKKNFFIIGLGGNNDNPNFYVSKMENIVDIQAENFGASTTAAAGKPKETEYKALNAANKINMPTSTDGSANVYVLFKANINGSYDWAVLNLTDAEANSVNMNMNEALAFSSSSVLSYGNIPNAFEAVDAESKIPQAKHAVYAQVAANKTLKGSWKYVKTYKESEEIEE